MSLTVVAVAGYRRKRAISEWLAGQVAFDLVTTLHCLAFAPITAGTTRAIRAHLGRLRQNAAGDSSILDGRDRYVIVIGGRSVVRCSCMQALRNQSIYTWKGHRDETKDDFVREDGEQESEDEKEADDEVAHGGRKLCRWGRERETERERGVYVGVQERLTMCCFEERRV